MYEELKKLAEAVNERSEQIGEPAWYKADCLDHLLKSGHIDAEFIAANPSAVLALIAENESLKHAIAAGSAREWDLRSQVRAAKESRARVVQSNKALRKDLESHKRMLLSAACDIGSIGKALKADMNADGDELLGMAVDLKAQNTRMMEWLKDISRTSGDKGAVMGARQLLKELGQ